jgi:hypothetical protein
MGARIPALNFLTDLWLALTINYEENDSLTSTYIEILTGECKHESRVVQASAFALLYKIIDHLTSVRNGFAPIFFKTLIFLFIEHFMDKELREWLEASFVQLFD